MSSRSSTCQPESILPLRSNQEKAAGNLVADSNKNIFQAEVMSLGLLGKKIGMTHVYDEDGAAISVTVLDVSENHVIQVKNQENLDYCPVGELSQQNTSHFGLNDERIMEYFLIIGYQFMVDPKTSPSCRSLVLFARS